MGNETRERQTFTGHPKLQVTVLARKTFMMLVGQGYVFDSK